MSSIVFIGMQKICNFGGTVRDHVGPRFYEFISLRVAVTGPNRFQAKFAAARMSNLRSPTMTGHRAQVFKRAAEYIFLLYMVSS